MSLEPPSVESLAGSESPRPATPESGSEVSLAEILAFAEQNSPILSAARSTRSRAEAGRVAAAIALPSNPQVSVAVGQLFGVSGTGVDAEVSLTQQLQIAGERGQRIDLADRVRDLTDAEIEQIEWTVHCDVHAVFQLALVERQRARLAEQVVEFQRSVLTIVEQRAALGETASYTVRLAEAELAQARSRSVAAEQSVLGSRIRLAQLSGWPVETPPLPVGEPPAPHDPPALAELEAIALEQLPSLQVGAAKVREAEAQTDLANREAWPQPTIGVQYRREGNPSSEGPYNSVMGVVVLPIPSFQRNQGERARARAEVSVAEAELAADQQLLVGRIAGARSEVVAAAERSRAYGAEIVPQFEENLALLRRSFELGEIDILDLSVGRERFLSIQSDALIAQQDYFVALAGLERVVGVELGQTLAVAEGP